MRIVFPSFTKNSIWDQHVHTVLFKMGDWQGPTIHHRESCSILCSSLDGREVWGRMDTCLYMVESLCCPPETITTLLIGSFFVCSVAKSCQTPCDPRDRSMPGSPALHYLLAFAQIHYNESVMLSNHLVLCHFLFILPSIFPQLYSNIK